ncbi:hypothetical protein B0H13DRAFT_2375884 [Mycena leptocephala]|nr:hypothetical protein B0H13DRAFT_2375884 [Mycena leptocephala]
MAPKDTGKGLNESVAEFHERLIQISGADAEGLSEDNQILRINLRKAKREADEKRAREEEARRLRELQEKKREDDERKQKEAKKARKKAEKGKEKKKRDRDRAAVSDEVLYPCTHTRPSAGILPFGRTRPAVLLDFRQPVDPVAARNGFLRNEGLLSVSRLSVCPYDSNFQF